MTKRPWLVAILIASWYSWANSAREGLWAELVRGFPLTYEILTDVGDSFSWMLLALNVAIGAIAIVSFCRVTRCTPRQTLQVIALSGFAAAFVWANFVDLPEWVRAEPSNDYCIGFPLVYETPREIRLWSLALNAGIGVVWVVAGCGLVGRPRTLGSTSAETVLRWAFNVVLVLFLARLNTEVAFDGLIDGGFPLNYRPYCTPQDPCALWIWSIVVVDVMVAAGIILLLRRHVRGARMLAGGIGVCLALWVNLESWPYWYDWEGHSGGFGFPFPFGVGDNFSMESALLLFSNAAVSILGIVLLDRYVRHRLSLQFRGQTPNSHR